MNKKSNLFYKKSVEIFNNYPFELEKIDELIIEGLSSIIDLLGKKEIILEGKKIQEVLTICQSHSIITSDARKVLLASRKISNIALHENSNENVISNTLKIERDIFVPNKKTRDKIERLPPRNSFYAYADKAGIFCAFIEMYKIEFTDDAFTKPLDPINMELKDIDFLGENLDQ